MLFKHSVSWVAAVSWVSLSLLSSTRGWGSSRPEVDFSFSRDIPNAGDRATEQNYATITPLPTDAPPPAGSNPPKQQAGQAGGKAPAEAEAPPQPSNLTQADLDEPDMNVRTTNRIPENPASFSFRFGTAPNQNTNIPGVPMVSPNGTSNVYGTGGIPYFLGEPPENQGVN